MTHLTRTGNTSTSTLQRSTTTTRTDTGNTSTSTLQRSTTTTRTDTGNTSTIPGRSASVETGASLEEAAASRGSGGGAVRVSVAYVVARAASVSGRGGASGETVVRIRTRRSCDRVEHVGSAPNSCHRPVLRCSPHVYGEGGNCCTRSGGRSSLDTFTDAMYSS